MPFQDSRRLTGLNLLSPRPGAVLEACWPPRDGAGAGAQAAEALIAAWRRQARRMLDAVGWRGEELAVRRFGAGASLFLSAPVDALYTATEINEWAFAAAVAAVAAVAPGAAAGATMSGEASRTAGAAGAASLAAEPDAAAADSVGFDAAAFDAAAQRLRAAAAAERDPALLALRDAARAHGVSFLADDDLATVGLGAGSITWPRGELPPPGAVDWAAVHDVPVALVTGTNGKTTTVRFTAAMLTAAGHTAGVTTTDGIAVGGAVLDSGDYSGPEGARTLLRDRRVDAAVLETARGGLLRRGLALERVIAAAVTNVAADHLGGYGVEDLASLAETKLLVTRAVVPEGRAVLNADDPSLAARGTRGPSPVIWTSLEPRLPAAGAPRLAARGIDLDRHLAAGGDAVLLEGGEIVLARGRLTGGSGPPDGSRLPGAGRLPGGGRRDVVAPLSAVPIAFGGAARYNVANALAAIGLASALGLPLEAMADGLAALRNDDGDDNPGRGYLMEIDGFHALVDYAHNPHGLAALIELAGTLPARRRLLLLGQAGDRDDRAIRELAQTAWSLRPDRVIVKELPTMLRGRSPREVPALLEAELLRLGARPEALAFAPTEIEAVQQALAWARPGDLLVLLVHTQREEAMAALRRRRAVAR